MKMHVYVVVFLVAVFMFGCLVSAEEDYMTESGEIREVEDGEVMTDSGEMEEVGSGGGYMTDSGEERNISDYSDDMPSYDEDEEGPGY